MGTRNLTLVIKDNETRIAQYGQWDGYPSGQGLTVFEFLTKKGNIEKLSTRLDQVRFYNEQELRDRQAFLDHISTRHGRLTSEQYERYHKKYPFDSREHGANILNEIIDSKENEIVLQDASSFGEDEACCEWAYAINLDDNQLHIYTNGTHGKPKASFNFQDLESKDAFLKVLEDDQEPSISKQKIVDRLSDIVDSHGKDQDQEIESPYQ